MGSGGERSEVVVDNNYTRESEKERLHSKLKTKKQYENMRHKRGKDREKIQIECLVCVTKYVQSYRSIDLSVYPSIDLSIPSKKAASTRVGAN